MVNVDWRHREEKEGVVQRGGGTGEGGVKGEGEMTGRDKTREEEEAGRLFR